jgi:hypothetical protein
VRQQELRNGDAQRLGGPEIDSQVELGRPCSWSMFMAIPTFMASSWICLAGLSDRGRQVTSGGRFERAIHVAPQKPLATAYARRFFT